MFEGTFTDKLISEISFKKKNKTVAIGNLIFLPRHNQTPHVKINDVRDIAMNPSSIKLIALSEEK